MNGSIRFDIVLLALVLSAVAHFALMRWAEPKVMTHVNRTEQRHVRHGASRVKPATDRPDPVKMDVVKDVPAPKDAPKADETVVSAPAPDSALPPPEAKTPVPAVAELAETVSRLRPDVEAPAVMESARSDLTRPVAGSAAGAPAVMSYDVPTPSASPSSGAGAGAPPSVAETVAEIAPPEIAAEALDPVEEKASARDEPRRMEEEKSKEEVFRPLAEVMPEVDEKLVAREKEAVRALIDSPSAADLAAHVALGVKTASADGRTLFRVTVSPKADLPVMPKDVVILIDASGSIGNERLTSCRKAARELLRTCTNSDDRFNLVAFRDRFAYAFRTWRNCDAESFSAADAWLGTLAAHGRTDVFSTIRSVLTLPRDPRRALIALVVTDGDANVGVWETERILEKFTALNDGLVSVYMYGVKAKANRELIELLTKANRGESEIFDGWFRWAAGNGIGKLSERFRDPVLTDLRVVFPSTCPAEAYPALLRNLCRGGSVEIVGSVAGKPSEIAFSLKGLAGEKAYEGYFRLPLAGAPADETLAADLRRYAALEQRLHGRKKP